MTDIEVRPATEADAAAVSALNATVQALHAEAYPALFKPPAGETFSAETVREILERPETRMLLALVDGAPVGYVYAQVVRRPESAIRRALDMVYIHHISVDTAYQGHGVGRALIDAAKAVAQAEGITHVELDVWAFNSRARAFFARQGFEVYNERMWLEVG